MQRLRPDKQVMLVGAFKSIRDPVLLLYWFYLRAGEPVSLTETDWPPQGHVTYGWEQ